MMPQKADAAIISTGPINPPVCSAMTPPNVTAGARQAKNKNRIEAMKVRYGDSVDFVACNNTIMRFRNQGIPVDLIDTAHVAPSALQYVVDRLKEGWTYVAI